MEFQGSFGYLGGGVKNAGLGGGGSLAFQGKNGRLVARRAPGWLRIPACVLSAAATVIAVAIGAMFLAENDIFDFFEHRKGPVALGLLGFVAMAGAWVGMDALTRLLFGREMVVEAPSIEVRTHPPNVNALQLVWSQNGKSFGTLFKPKGAEVKAQLLAHVGRSA